MSAPSDVLDARFDRRPQNDMRFAIVDTGEWVIETSEAGVEAPDDTGEAGRPVLLTENST